MLTRPIPSQPSNDCVYGHQARRAFLLCLLALASQAWAQLPVVQLPQLKPSGITADLTDVAYRWVATDLANNTAISGNWTDRIQSASWLQGDSSSRPTNSSSGVWFDNTHWLTNAGLTIGSNCSFGLIVDVIDCGQFSGEVHPSLFENGRNTDDAGLMSLQFDFNASPKYPLIQRMDATLGVHQFTTAPFRTTNQFCDILLTQAATNSSGSGNTYCYTNAVLCANPSSGAFPGGGIYYWGSRDPSLSGIATYPSFLMLNNARASSAFAYLREFWIWTNNIGSTGTLLSATRINNFHKYGTNTYGYSP